MMSTADGWSDCDLDVVPGGLDTLRNAFPDEVRAERCLSAIEGDLNPGAGMFVGWMVLSTRALYCGDNELSTRFLPDPVVRFATGWFASVVILRGKYAPEPGKIGVLVKDPDGNPFPISVAESAAGLGFTEALSGQVRLWDLKREYAYLATEGAALLSEVDRMEEIRIELATFGEEPDFEMAVETAKARIEAGDLIVGPFLDPEILRALAASRGEQEESTEVQAAGPEENVDTAGTWKGTMRASQVGIAQLGEVQGEPVHKNSVTIRDAEIELWTDRLEIRGSGLRQSYGLREVQRVEITSDGSRFGMLAPGDVTGFLEPEHGTHIVRIDAKRLGLPTRAQLREFSQAVVDAVRRAGGSI